MPTKAKDDDAPDDDAKTVPIAEGDSESHPLDAPTAAAIDPGPTPITPASSPSAYDQRVKYEDQVNSQVAAWWEANRGAITDTFLAGGTVELDHSLPDDKKKPAPKS